MSQPVQDDENKPCPKSRKGLKKTLQLLAAHTKLLRSNLSGVLFASYFNKGAQSVYQTALMKGLLAGLPAADPLNLECVFTINPPLCLHELHPVLPTSLLHHPLPYIEIATFTGASHHPHHPSTPYLPQNLSSIFLSDQAHTNI